VAGHLAEVAQGSPAVDPAVPEDPAVAPVDLAVPVEDPAAGHLAVARAADRPEAVRVGVATAAGSVGKSNPAYQKAAEPVWPAALRCGYDISDPA
jgi:hypothetical protein